MIKLFIILILILIVGYIINVRYDPLYKFLNKERDPKNFRNRVYFEKDYWEKIKQLPKEEPFSIVKKINTHIESDNIISYSLYGNNPKYYNYLDDIIDYVNNHLTNWVIRIYLHDQVDKILIDKLEKKNIQLYLVHDNLIKHGNSAGMFWRFLPLCEDKNVIIKDIDDIFDAFNNKNFINKFFNNNNNYKIKYNSAYPWPTNHIQGKNFYKKKDYKIPLEEKEIINYFHRTTFGVDEIFLSKVLYPRLDKNVVQKNNHLHKLFVRNQI